MWPEHFSSKPKFKQAIIIIFQSFSVFNKNKIFRLGYKHQCTQIRFNFHNRLLIKNKFQIVQSSDFLIKNTQSNEFVLYNRESVRS